MYQKQILYDNVKKKIIKPVLTNLEYKELVPGNQSIN